jgi:hypothetical protein
MKKILVSLPDGVVEILGKEVIGKIGGGYIDTPYHHNELVRRA